MERGEGGVVAVEGGGGVEGVGVDGGAEGGGAGEVGGAEVGGGGGLPGGEGGGGGEGVVEAVGLGVSEGGDGEGMGSMRTSCLPRCCSSLAANAPSRGCR